MTLVPYVFTLLFIIYSIPCESLKCYECTGHVPCGQGQINLIVDCAGKCMVYRNQYDGGTIIRRCCTNDCGTVDGLQNYEGRYPTYLCSEDMCNSALSDVNIGGIIDQFSTSTTSVWLTTTNDVSSREPSSSLSCYECTDYYSQCGINEMTLIHGCQACMVYLNEFDGNTVIRRCCTSGCGSSGTIGDYEGRTAYFCSSNRCNGIGTEAVLTGGTVPSSITTMTTSLSFIQTTTTVTVQSSFQCYDCSGPACGSAGSNLLMNCPTCMVYRNPSDQTKIERHCCWWACGPSNSISTYNGIPTYFCSYDKCNGYGSENVFGPLIPTTSMTTLLTTTSTTITTTYSSSTCILNCQHGSIPEVVDGCFCYCLENTYGRECENVNCIQPDFDAEICSLENQLLCDQSETFAYVCLHLCGKC